MYSCIAGWVSAKPEPVIKWYKNEIEIDNKADYEITCENGRAMLTIPEVFSEDAGSYVCVSSNKAGTAKSTAQLTVKRKLSLPLSSSAPSSVSCHFRYRVAHRQT